MNAQFQPRGFSPSQYYGENLAQSYQTNSGFYMNPSISCSQTPPTTIISSSMYGMGEPMLSPNPTTFAYMSPHQRNRDEEARKNESVNRIKDEEVLWRYFLKEEKEKNVKIMQDYKTNVCHQFINFQKCSKMNDCFDYHSESERRRKPFKDKKLLYRDTMCPNMIQNQSCDQKDQCSYAHNSNEINFHPAKFKTYKCNNPQCQKEFCPGVHKNVEERLALQVYQYDHKETPITPYEIPKIFMMSPLSAHYSNEKYPQYEENKNNFMPSVSYQNPNLNYNYSQPSSFGSYSQFPLQNASNLSQGRTPYHRFSEHDIYSQQRTTPQKVKSSIDEEMIQMYPLEIPIHLQSQTYSRQEIVVFQQPPSPSILDINCASNIKLIQRLCSIQSLSSLSLTEINDLSQLHHLSFAIDSYFGGNKQVESYVHHEHLNLEVFKTNPCPYHYQHNHKHCPYYHSAKDRRRDPSLYVADLCDFYESEDCPLGAECPRAHNRVERLYHKTKYKTKFCNYYPRELDSCEYGQFCCFAHNEEDIKVELIHKMEYNEEFYLYYFKTVWCPFTHEHNKALCVYAHNWYIFMNNFVRQDFRRNPHLFTYSKTLCENWRSETFISSYKEGCGGEELCPNCHGWKEQLYHPYSYKLSICPDSKKCQKGYDCPYYHNSKDRRHPTMISPYQKLRRRNLNVVYTNNINDLKELIININMIHNQNTIILQPNTPIKGFHSPNQYQTPPGPRYLPESYIDHSPNTLEVTKSFPNPENIQTPPQQLRKRISDSREIQIKAKSELSRAQSSNILYNPNSNIGYSNIQQPENSSILQFISNKHNEIAEDSSFKYASENQLVPPEIFQLPSKTKLSPSSSTFISRKFSGNIPNQSHPPQETRGTHSIGVAPPINPRSAILMGSNPNTPYKKNFPQFYSPQTSIINQNRNRQPSINQFNLPPLANEVSQSENTSSHQDQLAENQTFLPNNIFFQKDMVNMELNRTPANRPPGLEKRSNTLPGMRTPELYHRHSLGVSSSISRNTGELNEICEEPNQPIHEESANDLLNLDRISGNKSFGSYKSESLNESSSDSYSPTRGKVNLQKKKSTFRTNLPQKNVQKNEENLQNSNDEEPNPYRSFIPSSSPSPDSHITSQLSANLLKINQEIDQNSYKEDDNFIFHIFGNPFYPSTNALPFQTKNKSKKTFLHNASVTKNNSCPVTPMESFKSNFGKDNTLDQVMEGNQKPQREEFLYNFQSMKLSDDPSAIPFKKSSQEKGGSIDSYRTDLGKKSTFDDTESETKDNGNSASKGGSSENISNQNLETTNLPQPKY